MLDDRSQNPKILHQSSNGIFFLVSVAVLITLLVVIQGAPQDFRRQKYDEHPREAYFNGSAFLKLSSTVSVYRHSGLSFRTCDPGRLFLQKYNDDSISLEVTPEGLLFVAVVDQQRYRARLNARLLNNAWHHVNLFFRLGNLTLDAAGHSQVCARDVFGSACACMLKYNNTREKK